MRISDWSSDVCSSDLAFAAGMIAQERWRGCGAGGLARSRLRDRNETGARMGRRMSGDLRAGSADVEMDLVGLRRRAGGGGQAHPLRRQAHIGEGAQHALGVAPRVVAVQDRKSVV